MADRDALLEGLEAVEGSLLDVGIAPDTGTPTALPPTEVRDHAPTRPTTTSTGR
jgi:hypothetical protein